MLYMLFRPYQEARKLTADAKLKIAKCGHSSHWLFVPLKGGGARIFGRHDGKYGLRTGGIQCLHGWWKIWQQSLSVSFWWWRQGLSLSAWCGIRKRENIPAAVGARGVLQAAYVPERVPAPRIHKWKWHVLFELIGWQFRQVNEQLVTVHSSLSRGVFMRILHENPETVVLEIAVFEISLKQFYSFQTAWHFDCSVLKW